MTEQEMQVWLYNKTQQAWLQFVADTAPPIDIIECIEVAFKAAYTVGFEEALALRKKEGF